MQGILSEHKKVIRVRNKREIQEGKCKEEKENIENAEMGKRKHSHDTKIVIKYYYERIRQNTGNFLKWMGLSVLTGLVVGGASAVFAGCIKAATEYRDTHNWIFMLLPVAGVLIVFMYEKIGRQDGGTNQVLATIKQRMMFRFCQHH